MGPKGTGLLYLSKDAQNLIRPMAFEHSHETYNDGNGVVNLAAILGLGKAIEYLEAIGMRRVEAHNLSLRDRLYDLLGQLDRLRIVSPPAGPLSSPMVTAVLPAEIEKRAFTNRLLDKHRLSIRATHDPFGFNGVRFCVHIFNTERDVKFATEAVRQELTR
jgi:cysteine desulfurase/selenocysteine lyase